MEELDFTGERYVPGMKGDIEIEHLHRYALALELSKGKNVLDIASGEGYGSYLLSMLAKSVVGVDISKEAILHSSMKYIKSNLTFLCGSADRIPCESHSFDLVVSFETIEHHDKHEEMLQEIKRVLKPDGILILSSPEKLYYSDMRNFRNEFHVKELYLDDLKFLISKYFKYYQLYFQKTDYVSIIVPKEIINAQFLEFSGNENVINRYNCITSQLYDIVIATDNKKIIKDLNIGISVFSGNKFYLEQQKELESTRSELESTRSELESTRSELNKIINSNKYRIAVKLDKIARKTGVIYFLKFLLKIYALFKRK